MKQLYEGLVGQSKETENVTNVFWQHRKVGGDQ